MRLAADGHGQAQVLDAVLDVARGQKFLAELNLLEEEALNGLLIAEIRQRWPLIRRRLFRGQPTPLAELFLEVGRRATSMVEIDAISDEGGGAQTGAKAPSPRARQTRHHLFDFFSVATTRNSFFSTSFSVATKRLFGLFTLFGVETGTNEGVVVDLLAALPHGLNEKYT